MRVIISNDDFGLTYGFTDAIKDSFLSGITTSTSIRPNGTAFNYATRILKNDLRKIGLGIHVNLTDGSKYRYSFLQYFILLSLGNVRLKRYIEKDLDGQIRKCIKLGIDADHIDSERHVHMIPQIFQIVCRLCNKYNIKRVRFTNEPFFLSHDLIKDIRIFLNQNFIKFIVLKIFAFLDRSLLIEYGLKTTEAFYGILYTDNIDTTIVKNIFADAKKRRLKSIEILGHPAYSGDKRDKKFTSKFIKHYVETKNRGQETKTFLDKNGLLSSHILKNNISLGTFKDV